MQDTKYVCPECHHESRIAGSCPNCQTMLLATCPICGNPVIGEHIHLKN